MKRTVFCCIGLLLIVALIPFASGIKGVKIPNLSKLSVQSSSDEEALEASTETQTEPLQDEILSSDNLSDEEIEIIVCKVMEHITEDADGDTKRAMLAICKTNYLYLKSQDNTDFEADISKYSDDFLAQLLNIYKEDNFILTLNGEIVPIPLTPQNGGYTATCDEYPYIQSVASPWDSFSESYIRSAVYPCGVSIYGLGYLCEQGLDWKEALSWYLPNFTID